MSEESFKSGLDKATKELGKYFGIMSKDDFMGKLVGMYKLDWGHGTTTTVNDIITAAPAEAVGQIFLDATEGAFFTKDIIKKIDDFLQGKTVVAGDIGKIDSSEAQVIKSILDILYEPATFDEFTNAKKACCMWHPENTHAKGGDPEVAASMWEMIQPKAEENAGINKEPTAPSNESPGLSATMIYAARLSPAHRDSGAVSLFMNCLPTHEISRAIPYLNIQFIFNKPPIDAFGRPSGMSQYTFLQGRKVMEEGGTADAMVGAFPKEVARGLNPNEFGTDKNDNPAKEMSYAGMELFTTPQSMLNADEPEFVVFQEHDGKKEAVGGPRSAPVIDKFRPFASVDGLSIDVSPVGGMMCHKTANMTITLHDRSRLGEISELVSPALFGNTHLILEYGWSHPDGGPASDNYFGQFINALRVKEKYHVVNSSFKFDDAGQVTVSLQLGMLGDADLDKAGIGTDTEIKEFQEEIEKLVKVIRDIVSKVSGESGNGAKSIGGGDWIGKVSSASGALSIDKDTMKAIRKYIRQGRARAPGDPRVGTDPTGDDVRAALNKLTGDKADGTGGIVGKLKERVAEIVKGRKDLLTDPASGDPFFRTIGFAKKDDPVSRKFVKVCTPATYNRALQKELGHSRIKKSARVPKGTYRKFVSLGKVMSVFVGQPLAAGGAYDEVQMFFYAFNPYASYVKDFNIAQYPIDVNRFKAELDRITEVEPNITLRRFLGFLQSKFIGDQTDYAWGMSSKYKTDKEGNRVLRSEKTKATVLYDMKQARLKDAYQNSSLELQRDLIFKPPRLGIFMEAVPVHKDSKGGSTETAGEIQTILRVHIYDKQCNVYEGIGQMLKQARNDEIGAINSLTFTPEDNENSTTANASKTGIAEAWEIQRDKAKDLGLLEEIGTLGQGKNEQDAINDMNSGKAYFRLKGGFPALKDFVKSTMPSMVYGSQNSAILKANLSSQNNPALTTIHLMRGGHGDSESNVLSTDKGVPLKVSPTSLDLDVIGCPIIRYGQQFFIDFGTGTTADNVYVVNGISHKLGPGEFSTSLKMIQYDTFGQYETMLSTVVKGLAQLQHADETNKS